MGGNVGIGTWAPAGLLEVGLQKLDVTPSGNVGIGSVSPGQALDVQGTVRASGFSGRIVPRVVTAADATSITPNTDNADITYQSNSQATGTLTIGADTGTPVNGQKWILKIKSTNVQTFSWNAVYVSATNAVGATTVGLPTATTGGSAIDYVGFIYDSVNSHWDCVAVTQGYS
jgi:hypothetical protein